MAALVTPSQQCLVGDSSEWGAVDPCFGLCHDGDSDILPLNLLLLPFPALFLCLLSNVPRGTQLDSTHYPLEAPLWGGCSFKATSGLWLAWQWLPWSSSVTGVKDRFPPTSLGHLRGDQGDRGGGRLPETLQRS